MTCFWNNLQNNVPALSVCAVFCMSLIVLLFCPLYHPLRFSVSDYLFDTFKHSFHILRDVVISFKLRSSPPNPNIILFFRWFLMFIIPICCGFGKFNYHTITTVPQRYEMSTTNNSLIVLGYNFRASYRYHLLTEFRMQLKYY
jgi:hypothetical protein